MAIEKPEVIFFDVYGTLAGFDPPREKIQQAAASFFGLELDRNGIDRGYQNADRFMAQQNARSPVRLMLPEKRDQFFARYEQLVLAGAGHEVDLETAGKIWAKVRSQEYGWTLFEDVLPGFKQLQQLGYRIAAISNMPMPGEQMCAEIGLTGHVEFGVTSGDVGAEKPDPRIFNAALEKAKVDPSWAVMVGDSISSDLRAAEAVGMNAILMDRYDNHPSHEGHPRATDVYEVVKLLDEM